MINESLLSFEEKTVYQLRSLYLRYGYMPYKMGKFEEYELYIRNKDFLVSDRVISFNDTNGKLMALKPDVTLSIIKNGEDEKGIKQKVFYNENVYRVSDTTHCFKEIMQTGLECIGDIGIYDIYEVISLAAESLAVITENFCIEISNLDLVVSAVASVCNDAEFVSKAMKYISEKNSHDLKRLCDKYGVPSEDCDKLLCFISVYGERKNVISKLGNVFGEKELSQLTLLSEMLDNSAYSEKIKFDFSVVNDMNYYNGFVYNGFVDGISSGVLAGGQYDNMMKKMNRRSGAVGFAIYLDSIAELFRENARYGVDCLILYDETTAADKLISTVSGCTASGDSVSVLKEMPDKLQFKKILDLRKKG